MASTDLMSSSDRDRAYWEYKEAIYDENVHNQQLRDSARNSRGIDYRYVKPQWKVEKECAERNRAMCRRRAQHAHRYLKSRGIRSPSGPHKWD